MSVIGGKLKFKGNFQKKLEKEEKKLKKPSPEASVEKEIIITPKNKEPILIEFEPTPATGRIITSGLTIHGKDTKFMKEIKNGDFIIVQNPVSLIKEEKPVAAVLSDKSLSLGNPFNSDIVTFSTFEIRKKSEYKLPDESLEEQYSQKLSNLSKKIKKEAPVLEYREKKGMWGYKTIKEQLNQEEVTREQLLDLRSKKNRDKFCWI